jgi:2-polyprenyl-3-methyl-5-hydroxy-6-metoxy-1,4-benzoquinol methylase
MQTTAQSKPRNRFEKRPEYFASRREDLLSMIPSACKTILDVGCGSGECWKGFKAEVSGVELNEDAARIASGHMKQVVSGDIEKTALPFKPNYFDCIVFADVLEHLYDPWGILNRFMPHLASDGHILISIPNIRHYRVLRSLVFKGKFTYEESGILDVDHVRFFTRKEILEMVEEAGLEVVEVRRKISASGKYRVLNSLLFGAMSDFLAEQFYILAKAK